MDLFHLHEEPHGDVFLHPHGYLIWRALESYMRRAIDEAGYQEVKTPQVMDARQWEKSGQWGKYRENMLVVPVEVPNTEAAGPLVSEAVNWLAIKPMNHPDRKTVAVGRGVVVIVDICGRRSIEKK